MNNNYYDERSEELGRQMKLSLALKSRISQFALK